MPIEIYNLASTPKPYDETRPRCEVFRATVRRPDHTNVKAHLKVMEKQTMAVELLVNALAKKLDLPVPDCFLVRVKKPQKNLFALSECFERMAPTDEFAVFGSATIEHPSLDHALRGRPAGQRILEFIREIADIESAAIFDEWIANGDRHEENILLCDLNTWWIIDNDRAFNEGVWHNGALAPKRRYDNHLGDILLSPPVYPPTLRLWKDIASVMSSKGKNCDATASVQEANTFKFLSPTQAQLLCDFLEERIVCLADLVGKRLSDAATRSSCAPALSANSYQMRLPLEPPSSP